MSECDILQYFAQTEHVVLLMTQTCMCALYMDKGINCVVNYMVEDDRQ